MIRTIITAHITADALRELTLQINDRSLGKLALQRQQHYVMTGNRRVQMVAGLITDTRRPNAVAEDKHQQRLWEACFRELQTRGMTAFPDVVRRDELHADFLALIDEKRFICYTDEEFGIYLHRAGRLYRVQPLVRPSSAPRFAGLDFYAFDVEAEDNVLILNPGFVDLFEASELENVMSSMRQISAVMSWLTDLAQTYGDGEIKPWIGFQIGRISVDQLTDEGGRRGGKRRRFPTGFPPSKVTRLAGGNVLIPVPRDDGTVPEPETVRERPRLGSGAPDRPSLRPDPRYPSASRTLAEHESRVTRLDRLKTQEFKDVSGGLSRIVRRLRNLFPGQRGLSLLAFIAIILVTLVVVLFLLKTTLGIGNSSQSGRTEAVLVTAPATDASGEPVTLRSDFEIEWEVKANTLAVYSEPASGKMLAQLMRGDKLWKLAEPENGWVLVRLYDGRIGYAYDDILKE
jgi:hypothetical protein